MANLKEVLNTSATIVRDRLAAFMGFSHEGDRDLFKQFGYKRQLDVRDYVALYRRNAVAARIIRAFPKATWKDVPKVCDDEETKDETPFEKAWREFQTAKNLQFYFNRADRISGLGCYSVLLLGFAGGKLDEPLGEGKNELLYLTPYSQSNATITQFDLDQSSPRFGLPVMYKLQKGSPIASGRPTAQSKSILVHYSRVIHIAEDLDDDEVYGTPSLECVYNHLRDLEKVVGGSAETFWLNSRVGLSISADKDAVVTPDNIADMKNQVQEFEHQLRRTLAMQGVTTTVLNAAIADPKGNVDVLLDLIAGGKGIPKRILIGSERGELASSQDESNWSSRIEERRNAFATPSILIPFIDVMIKTENLPKPKEDKYNIEWPEVAAQSPKEKAEVAQVKTNAIRNYASTPGAELLVPIPEFREMLGLEAESTYTDDSAEPSPLDENNPEVTAQFGTGFGGKPADAAMNGLQISSLKDIVIAVGAKELPPDAAIALIMACFPSIDEATAKAMIDPMAKFEPPPPKIPPAPGMPLDPNKPPPRQPLPAPPPPRMA